MASTARTGIVYSDRYLTHYLGDGHPESPDRLRRIMEVLAEKEVLTSRNISLLEPRLVSEQDLLRVHGADYIERIRYLSEKSGMLTLDTPVPRGTYELARLSAGGAVNAGEAVVTGKVDSAFALIRPPGHHAGRNFGGGFCYFNNIAVMMEYLRANHGVKKFMVLDWDVHHGNGTQDIYYRDPTVLYFSTHQVPLYPGTGSMNELGEGEGEGYNINLPLPVGASGANYRMILEELFAPLARNFKPDLIVVSAGQDAHFEDPIASLRFSVETYRMIAETVATIAREVCGGRIALVLEGGYHLEATAEAVSAIISALAALQNIPIRDPSRPPPQEVDEEVERRIELLKSILGDWWRF